MHHIICLIFSVFVGTISVAYVIVFTIYESAKWGLNVDFNDSSSSQYVARK